MTIADHKAAMAKLTTVAKTLGVTLPTAPNAEQQAQAATLKATSTDAFDLAYSEIQVAGHQKSIANTDTEIAGGADQTVKDYATYYLPVAQMHLTMAQSAVTNLGGTPGEVPAGTGGQAATTSGTTEGVEIGLLVVGGALLVGSGVVLARRRRVATA